MARFRRRKFSSSLNKVSFHRIVPNLATIVALCAGMSAVRFALIERWETAAALIVIAAIFDAMDGRLARMLGSVSRFGAQLDSLSDFMSFGIAPAFMLYLFALKPLGGIGWAIAMIYAVCMSLRLARFNVQAETPSPIAALKSQFFTGVPAPAAAILALTPLFLWLGLKMEIAKNPWFVSAILLSVSSLMISTLPTFAFKTLKIAQHLLVPVLIVSALFIAGLISAPWITILILNGIYALTFPFSLLRFRSLKHDLLLSSSSPPL